MDNVKFRSRTILNVMGELKEFAEALLDQLDVEINEEKEIAELSLKIEEDPSFTAKFEDLEKICQEIFPVITLFIF